MNHSAAVADMLVSAGIHLVAGVPCSLLGGLIEALEAHPLVRYVGAANEGDAVAIAVGAGLSGCGAAVLMQNSGLGNAISPLTSLVATFDLPVLLIVGWRGGPAGEDEPQHRLMGNITPTLLRQCGIEVGHCVAGSEITAVVAAIDIFKDGRSSAILIESGMGRKAISSRMRIDVATAPLGLITDLRLRHSRPSRADILETIHRSISQDTAVIATTGFTSRELFNVGDRPSHFYQVGSMGCASSIGLGVALTSHAKVAIIDGDGAALMRLGSFATIGAEQPERFLHILLDNQCHESTGGQLTSSSSADLGLVASACGYKSVYKCDDVDGLQDALAASVEADGPQMIHVDVGMTRSGSVARPALKPKDNSDRFSKWLMAVQVRP